MFMEPWDQIQAKDCWISSWNEKKVGKCIVYICPFMAMAELMSLMLSTSVLDTLGKMKFTEVVMVITEIHLIASVYLSSSKWEWQHSWGTCWGFTALKFTAKIIINYRIWWSSCKHIWSSDKCL